MIRVDSWEYIIVESVIACTYSYIPTPLFSLHKIGLDQEEAGVSSSAGTTTPFSSNIFAKDPSLCMLIKISHPPTNSLSTYSWGIVGQSEYSLIPVVQSLASQCRQESNPAAPFMSILRYRDIGREYEVVECLPDLNSSSSNTLYAVNFSGSTPSTPKICIVAREKPHCGVSGVPFMNNTTGVVATALSIAALVSLDSNRACRGVRKERRGRAFLEAREMGRAIWRKACSVSGDRGQRREGMNVPRRLVLLSF